MKAPMDVNTIEILYETTLEIYKNNVENNYWINNHPVSNLYDDLSAFHEGISSNFEILRIVLKNRCLF